MINLRKGQFTTYLKPVIVIIFALLLIFLVQRVLSFQIFVEDEESRAEFLQGFNTNFERISACLSPENSSSLYTLDSEKLEEYDNIPYNKEPRCAEDFRFGYYVEVEHSCLEEVDSDVSIPCSPGTFSFGISEGSTVSSVRSELTTTYPVNIKIEEDLKVPGTLELTMVDGDLEEITGILNRAALLGKKSEHEYDETKSFSTEQRICTDNDQVCIGADGTCTDLRGEVEDFTLTPGNYVLGLQYDEVSGKVVVSGGEEGGC